MSYVDRAASRTAVADLRYRHDLAGNTTGRQVGSRVQTLAWDAEGNLATVEEVGEDPVRMVYDTEGNRLIRDDGDTVTAYLPHTELTWDRSTGAVDGTRYFTHAGQVVAVCTGQDVADWTWMGVDHHGSTTTPAVNAFTTVEQVRRMDPYGTYTRTISTVSWQVLLENSVRSSSRRCLHRAQFDDRDGWCCHDVPLRPSTGGRDDQSRLRR